MNTNETNNNNQNEQLADLPLTDEQAEQAKGGTELKYNFGGIEGAASASTTRPTSGAGMQDTEKHVTGMFS